MPLFDRPPPPPPRWTRLDAVLYALCIVAVWALAAGALSGG